VRNARKIMRRLQILICLILLSLNAIGQDGHCKKPEYGKWDLKFKDEKIGGYTIWFKLDTFTKYLKDGKEVRGQLNWDKSNCLYNLTFSKSQSDTTTTEIWMTVSS
jgi:hypothetical protein